MPQHKNRLAAEKSPYLLQHAHNPVDWYPWGPEAFEKARNEDKPIFLSVGYSACHWCHVMERESFESEAIAALLNERFVSIKVDREERPDVDDVYMNAVQIMTGQGGWPMSVFLTPDGRPFYGGTYFPPESRYGRIGFPSLIHQLADAYTLRRSEVEEVAENLTAELKALTRQKTASSGSEIDADALLALAIDDMAERFDSENGGFGGAPKFPPHHALRLLCEAAARTDDQRPESMLVTTLNRMALGGIYDHIGGGFHRYATDAVWLLPHFEKMLYDNALLARVYAEAFQITGLPAYARIARETCDWVLRDLTDPAGGFYAALDADSEGEEGRYYVWTSNEVIEAAGVEAGRAFCAQYHIAPDGNFRDEATRQPSGTNIPFLSVGPSETELPEELSKGIARTRAILRELRYQRVSPQRDNKVITAWNGLMIGALATAGQILNEPQYIDAARRAADFCLTTLRPNGELLRRYADGEAAIPAYLDDHAFLADGLLDLYGATQDITYRDAARSLADVILERFADHDEGGFFYTANTHEALIARTKDIFDGALPASSGVAARVLAWLGSPVPDDPDAKYAEAARSVLQAYQNLMQRAPQGFLTLLEAALTQQLNKALPPPAPFTLRAEPPVLTLTPGESGIVSFRLNIPPGFHINSWNPPDENLIRTIATFTCNALATVGPVTYPEAQTWTDPLGVELPVYSGDSLFSVPVRIVETAIEGGYRLRLTVQFQACSESACQPPAEATAETLLDIRASK